LGYVQFLGKHAPCAPGDAGSGSPFSAKSMAFCGLGRPAVAPLIPSVKLFVLPAFRTCAPSGCPSVHLQRGIFVAVFQHLLKIVAQKRRDGPSFLVLVDMPQLVGPQPPTVTRIPAKVDPPETASGRSFGDREIPYVHRRRPRAGHRALGSTPRPKRAPPPERSPQLGRQGAAPQKRASVRSLELGAAASGPNQPLVGANRAKRLSDPSRHVRYAQKGSSAAVVHEASQ